MEPSPRLLQVEMLHLPATQNRSLHRHPFAELVYVVKGGYEVSCDGQTVRGRSGDIFYYPAGFEHSPGYNGRGPTQLYIIQYEEGHSAQADRPRLLHDDTGRLLVGIEWLWELFPVQSSADALAVDGLLVALLHQHRRARGSEGNDLVRRLRHKLLQNLAYPYELSTMAMVAGYSKFHFVRLWKQLTGTTPMKYLQELRVKRAIQLLQHTDLPLKLVASQVGIGNVDYLSRLVRKETGRTPTALRRGEALTTVASG